MKTFIIKYALSVALFSHFFTITHAQQFQWVVGYAIDWDSQRMPVAEIDWNGLTQVVHMNLDPSITPPYYTFPHGQAIFEEGCWNPCGGFYQRQLIDSAHARGVKVLLDLGGMPPDGTNAWTWLTSDSARCQAGVGSMLAYARSKGYDGVDVDWEFPWSNQRDNVSLLMRVLRRGLNTWTPRGILSVALPREYEQAFDPAVLNANVDQCNTMSYDCNGWWSSASGFHAPLYNPTPNWPNYPPESGALNANDKIPTWINAGLQPGKIGFGLAFYGYRHDGITLPGQHGTNSYFIRHYTIVNDYLARGIGTRGYDSLAHQPFLSVAVTGLQQFINYDDEVSLPVKIRWARNRGLGGICLFDINSDYNPDKPVGQRHPLMKAVRQTLTSVQDATEGGQPNGFALEQNYPNPFNPSTNVRFSLPASSHVRLSVFNLLGQELRTLVDEIVGQGLQEITWDGRDNNGTSIASGVYFYKLQAGNFSAARKMILAK